MIALLASTMLIAIAALAYATYKGGQCDSLEIEAACARKAVERWKNAYESVAAENRAINCLGRGCGKDS